MEVRTRDVTTEHRSKSRSEDVGDRGGPGRIVACVVDATVVGCSRHDPDSVFATHVPEAVVSTVLVAVSMTLNRCFQPQGSRSAEFRGRVWVRAVTGGRADGGNPTADDRTEFVKNAR